MLNRSTPLPAAGFGIFQLALERAPRSTLPAGRPESTNLLPEPSLRLEVNEGFLGPRRRRAYTSRINVDGGRQGR